MTTGKIMALTVWSFVGKVMFLLGHSFSSKEQGSLNFMAAVTIHSGFGAQENKICFHFLHFYFYSYADKYMHAEMIVEQGNSITLTELSLVLL